MAQAKKPTKTKAAPKAKTQEETQAKAIDYSIYDYRLKDVLHVKAEEVVKLRDAIAFAVQQGTKETFPTVNKWVALASGVEVEKPSAEAIAKGQVRAIMDLEKTFAQDNLKIEYEAWVPKLVEALNLFNQIHITNVDLGHATERSVLQKEQEEARKKAEEAKAAAEVGPQPEPTKA